MILDERDLHLWRRWCMLDALYIVGMIFGAMCAGLCFALAIGVFVT